LQAAIDALVSILSSGPVNYGRAKDEALKRAECSERLLRDAAKLLGIVYNADTKCWSLPATFDPFEHPGIQAEGGDKWWAQ
jgi:hypothetical protein